MASTSPRQPSAARIDLATGVACRHTGQRGPHFITGSGGSTETHLRILPSAECLQSTLRRTLSGSMPVARSFDTVIPQSPFASRQQRRKTPFVPRDTKRLVSVNGRVLHEGDSLAPDLRLARITVDGTIFSYQGYQFRQAAPQPTPELRHGWLCGSTYRHSGVQPSMFKMAREVQYGVGLRISPTVAGSSA